MLKNGNTVFFRSGQTLISLDNCVYTIKKDPIGNLYLNQIESFKYMELDKKAKDVEDLVCNHYNRNQESFGCIFDGISGMGKTQNIKNISVKLNLPVIFIDSEIPQEDIRAILDSINSDCILFFDEFEKIYRESERLLSLFDGIKTKNRVLTFVSFNEERGLSKHFFGRPGRFLFRFRYYPLEDTEALEFITSRVKGLDEKRLKEYLSKIDNLSYDICDKMVKILKLHPDQKIENITRVLNVNISETCCSVSLYKQGVYYQNIGSFDDFNDDDRTEVYISTTYTMGYFPLSPEIKDLKMGETLEVALTEEFKRMEHKSEDIVLRFTKIKKFEPRSISFGY
jgi:hypothetical protein